MLAIKLKKIGKKHQPSFRVIVSEKRSKMGGRCVEDLGWLNPKSKQFNIKKERAIYWLENGAQPTDTVHNLLVRAKVIIGPKKPVHSLKKKKEGDIEVKTEEIKTNENTEIKEEQIKEEIKEEVKEESKEENIEENFIKAPESEKPKEEISTKTVEEKPVEEIEEKKEAEIKEKDSEENEKEEKLDNNSQEQQEENKVIEDSKVEKES